MTPGTDTSFQTFPYYRKIMLHSLSSGHFHFVKNMIIGTANQNSGFLKSNIFYQLEVLLICPNPTGNLRKLIALFQTFINSVSVFFAVKKEFTLTDFSIWSSQFMKVFVDSHNLTGAIRRSGLLSIPEGCVCNPDIIRHMVWDDSVIKSNLWYFTVGEQIAENIW